MKTPKTSPLERSFIRKVLIVLALASLFFLAWQLRVVLLMLFGAVVVASVFRAIADLLHKWLRLPDAVAVGTSVLIVLGLIVGLGMMFGSQVAQQFELLKETLPRAWKSLEGRLGEFGLGEALTQGVTGGSAFANVGRTIITVGSGVADTLGGDLRRHLPRRPAQFLPPRGDQADPARQAGAGRRRDDRFRARAAPVAQGPIDRDGHRRDC